MRNRLRSVLTMLGIVWGLVSVVILLAYGQGLGASVLHAFLNMGDNVIVVMPGQTSMQAGGQRAGKKIQFEYEDVEAVREEVPIVRVLNAGIALVDQPPRPMPAGFAADALRQAASIGSELKDLALPKETRAGCAGGCKG